MRKWQEEVQLYNSLGDIVRQYLFVQIQIMQFVVRIPPGYMNISKPELKNQNLPNAMLGRLS